MRSPALNPPETKCRPPRHKCAIVNRGLRSGPQRAWAERISNTVSSFGEAPGNTACAQRQLSPIRRPLKRPMQPGASRNSRCSPPRTKLPVNRAELIGVS
ncbi:MAG: hypothetical protein CO113_00330 [Elusimicrobia bacterium CG_4_9_14_3_um_filter_62_55]|nr:MAG: hypothetical protein COR54_13530 [Elusimicrobia bacterium CG22_combo_CG10-13_8_21_14_all_63_91]PJA14102.1 MAG: hypothetical protein COX66_13380 [Elusimicrobia bacterium CG_4_10_14_0_2_um_filter_63_34]PJB27058.1 MAG: hypothetical protein CO113_00330 [Elusimicrobia bacterium CG_4_9_14_3_um_filter_62_55]